MNTELRKKKNWFWKRFFQANEQWNFSKNIDNVRKHRDIKLVTTKARRNYLVSEPNYHTTKIFLKIYLPYKWNIFMNEPVYLGLSILEISKIVMFEFWYDFVKPKREEKAKLYYMDTDSLIVYIKTEDIYTDIAKGVETRFDASNYKLDMPMPKGKNK